ncbi:MAG: ThiF family adenylyltransferase [Thaumarchaeota archaeon]|nr:ThiF family adenylyltransferase [Candidatus Calditenuaceae archaeon]MDW8042572.1 ThiF family adenylyltransferase [Nitrososphaerota archaeon]
MDDDRYERQKRLWDQRKISSLRVLVGGAGALGNEVVKNLVQIGVKRVYVVDFDKVVPSNLNRCLFFRRSDASKRARKVDAVAKRAPDLNPDVEVIPVFGDIKELSEEVLRDVDISLGAFDNVFARLVLNLSCYTHNIPLVDGGMEGTYGMVQVVLPPDSPCVECGMTDRDLENMWERVSCSGDVVVEEGPKLPYIPMTGALIGAVQVMEAVKIALGLESYRSSGRWNDSVGAPMVGKSLLIDLKTNLCYTYELHKRADCNVCGI